MNVWMYACMCVWMDGWLAGWMDGMYVVYVVYVVYVIFANLCIYASIYPCIYASMTIPFF